MNQICKVCGGRTEKGKATCSQDCRRKNHIIILKERNERNKGKTYEQIYGNEKAKEIKNKKSNSFKGEKNPHFGGLKNSTKKKLSEWREGKTYEEIYGSTGAKIMREKRRAQMTKQNNNKNFRESTRIKKSMTMKGKSYEQRMGKEKAELAKKRKSESMKLSRNHQWQGGKSFEPYPLEFNDDLRKKIKEKYNYICQRCGISEAKSLKKFRWSLCIHHIDCDKQNNDESNLTPYCVQCHRLVHADLLKIKSI